MSSYLMDEDDEECPLCLDTLDISDLNFKPCPCGYSICRFCWHHIKENLNGRCPACRKPYDDAAIEFKPMKPEDLKRLQAAKKQREKEKKDADVMSRRHAANVRVKQRAQVHIQGMTTKIANEETLPTLKGPDQFGRFGKILKLFFSRRAHPPPGGAPASVLTPSTSSAASSSNTSTSLYTPVNVYINYSHPNEAHACIAAIDGTVTPDGHKLKAIWGTTRYCPAYLRGVKCANDNCMQAHEPGEEIETNTHPGSGGAGGHYSGHHTASSNSYMQQAASAASTSREEMVSLKHAWKEQGGSSHPASQTSTIEKPALPATASWASRPSMPQSSSSSSSPTIANNTIGSSRPLAPSSSSVFSGHNHSSSISSRFPKTQNHPLPPRPPSRTTVASLEAAKQNASTSASSASASISSETAVHKPATSKPANAAVASTVGKPSTSSVSSVGKSEVAPPAPPASDPSSSSTSGPGSNLPPGLPVTLTSLEAGSGRPVTPVSEFDRTLGNLGFGDGLSFNFNLSASPASGKGEDRSALSSLEDGEGQSGTTLPLNGLTSSSNTTSRSVSPDFLAAHGLSKDALFGNMEAPDDPSARYAHFDPFASNADQSGDQENVQQEVQSTPTPRFEAPPGLSRVSTATSSQDGSGSSGLGAIGKVPPGLPLPNGEDSLASRKSRFGFARQGSTERSAIGLPPGFSSAPGPSNGVSLPVSEFFKGIINGSTSPARPSSATSSASGNLAFSLPPGVFSPGSSSVNGTPFGASQSLPPSNLPSVSSSSELPLPPLDPSKATNGSSISSKTDLSDLFPGVNLAASFSGSSLPPSLIKSLGISLENVDVSASTISSDKLPNFAPMPLGTGTSIANQPLPPPPTSSSSVGPLPASKGHSGAINPPPGFGTSRQAQQAHAQHAQQAHQAHLAAQQAAAAQQQQSQGQHPRPPSAASGGSVSGSKGHNDAYGQYMSLQNAQSPPLPGTPGPFGGDGQRFTDPAIISYQNMNGYGHHVPYGHHNSYHQHGPGGPHDLAQQPQADYYNRYHPLPTPVQPQQTYNPYVPVSSVGMGGLGRLPGQALSQPGTFGLLRR